MTSTTPNDSAELAKRNAAVWAASQVEDGMAVGLGTGTTAAVMIDELGRRVAGGLRITGIATSEHSHQQAVALKIPMTDFSRQPRLDLTIDGADEVEEGSLNLIKGHGGALLREKIVAMASDRLLIVADERKQVKQLGSTFTLPVEVVPFGWETTAARLRNLGFTPELRKNEDGAPYITDGQHYILHCNLLEVKVSAEEAASMLKQTVGVVEHGLFLKMASKVVIGTSDGVRFLERAAKP